MKSVTPVQSNKLKLNGWPIRKFNVNQRQYYDTIALGSFISSAFDIKMSDLGSANQLKRWKSLYFEISLSDTTDCGRPIKSFFNTILYYPSSNLADHQNEFGFLGYFWSLDHDLNHLFVFSTKSYAFHAHFKY